MRPDVIRDGRWYYTSTSKGTFAMLYHKADNLFYHNEKHLEARDPLRPCDCIDIMEHQSSGGIDEVQNIKQQKKDAYYE